MATVCSLTTTFPSASENLLRDGEFAAVGGTNSAWQVVADKDGKAEPGQAADR
jgi:hypothetical protein